MRREKGSGLVGDKLATTCVYIGLVRVDSTWSHGIQRQREIHGLGERCSERASGHGSSLGATLASDCC